MSNSDWMKLSHVIDYVLQQPVKESPGAKGVAGDAEPKKKKQQPPKKEEGVEQLRLF